MLEGILEKSLVDEYLNQLKEIPAIKSFEISTPDTIEIIPKKSRNVNDLTIWLRVLADQYFEYNLDWVENENGLIIVKFRKEIF